MDPDYKLRLRFPKGPIDLAEVTRAYVSIPLELIPAVDPLNNSGRDDILQKSAPTIQFFVESLKKTMTPWSGVLQWTVPSLSVKILRSWDTWDLIGVGFTILRPYYPGKPEGLEVEINCQKQPSGGKLDCEVVPWELPQLTIE
ncbi:hypothetical protein B0I37DRAFT_197913 [Chaetomium sp. MPI-CAGE-AT-0009]|nr:hypothetical protein B0I37DRAFT_197913 [Chaetomium sp. MPI-CAGE-AT-0009]